MIRREILHRLFIVFHLVSLCDVCNIQYVSHQLSVLCLISASFLKRQNLDILIYFFVFVSVMYSVGQKSETTLN